MNEEGTISILTTYVRNYQSLQTINIIFRLSIISARLTVILSRLIRMRCMDMSPHIPL